MSTKRTKSTDPAAAVERRSGAAEVKSQQGHNFEPKPEPELKLYEEQKLKLYEETTLNLIYRQRDQEGIGYCGSIATAYSILTYRDHQAEMSRRGYTPRPERELQEALGICNIDEVYGEQFARIKARKKCKPL